MLDFQHDYVRGTQAATGINFVFNLIALRKTKIAYNFGLSECNRVNATHSGLS